MWRARESGLLVVIEASLSENSSIHINISNRCHGLLFSHRSPSLKKWWIDFDLIIDLSPLNINAYAWQNEDETGRNSYTHEREGGNKIKETCKNGSSTHSRRLSSARRRHGTTTRRHHTHILSLFFFFFSVKLQWGVINEWTTFTQVVQSSFAYTWNRQDQQSSCRHVGSDK